MATLRTTTSRRAMLAGLAAAPALTAPALALGAAGPDPIFAAIEKYKAAVVTRHAALMRTADFTDKSPFAHLPEDAPERVAAEEEHDAAADREFELLDELVEVEPTTVAGMAAWLEMLGVDPYWEVEGCRDVVAEPLIVMALERSPELMATLAAAARAIGGAS